MTTLPKEEIDIDFLKAELDIGCSTLRIAQSGARTNRADCQSVLAVARAALATIRRLEGGIEDIQAWRDIHARAHALKSGLAAVCADCALRAGCIAEENDADTRPVRRNTG